MIVPHYFTYRAQHWQHQWWTPASNWRCSVELLSTSGATVIHVPPALTFAFKLVVSSDQNASAHQYYLPCKTDGMEFNLKWIPCNMFDCKCRTPASHERTFFLNCAYVILTLIVGFEDWTFAIFIRSRSILLLLSYRNDVSRNMNIGVQSWLLFPIGNIKIQY